MKLGRGRALALAGALLVLATLARAGDPERDEVAAAVALARDPARLDEALVALKAAIRRHEEVERPRAARALLAAGDVAERLGRGDEARALYARVEALLPERRSDAEDAERRSRALRDGGGAFLESLLARAATARGRERLDRASTLRVDGAILARERRVPFSLAIARRPLRVRQDAPDLGFACGWNGTTGWRRSRSRGLARISGPALDDLVRWSDGVARDLLGTPAGTPRALSPTAVEGKQAQRVEWRGPAGDAYDVDLLLEDALPARATALAVGLDGEPQTLTLYYRGWRAVDGARFAERVDYYKGSELAYSFAYERFELDPTLEPAFFDPPREDPGPEPTPAASQPASKPR